MFTTTMPTKMLECIFGFNVNEHPCDSFHTLINKATRHFQKIGLNNLLAAYFRDLEYTVQQKPFNFSHIIRIQCSYAYVKRRFKNSQIQEGCDNFWQLYFPDRTGVKDVLWVKKQQYPNRFALIYSGVEFFGSGTTSHGGDRW